MSSGIVWLNQQEGKLLRVIRYHLMMFLQLIHLSNDV